MLGWVCLSHVTNHINLPITSALPVAFHGTALRRVLQFAPKSHFNFLLCVHFLVLAVANCAFCRQYRGLGETRVSGAPMFRCGYKHLLAVDAVLIECLWILLMWLQWQAVLWFVAYKIVITLLLKIVTWVVTTAWGKSVLVGVFVVSETVFLLPRLSRYTLYLM